MSGTAHIDPDQIRTTAAQFRSQSSANLSERIGMMRAQLPDVCSMFGNDPEDHPSQQMAQSYSQHAQNMLLQAENIVDALQRVAEGLDKMARDYEVADQNAQVV